MYHTIEFSECDADTRNRAGFGHRLYCGLQTCVCSNGLLIHSAIYDELAAKLIAAVRKFNLGRGTAEGVNIGPLINEGAATDVLDLTQDAEGKGAKKVAGGELDEQGNCFVQPTVLTEVTRDIRVFCEEIFGPVSPLIRFHTEEEAIVLANDTDVGLACYFYSRDTGRVWGIGEAFEYGIVGINEGIVSNEMAPFGGIKASGQGREGSKYVLGDYLEINYLCMGGIE